MANNQSNKRSKQYSYNNTNYSDQQLRDYHHFTLSNILSDPFLLSTISIGSIGWVIALCGSIIVSISSTKFPVFTWWGIASEFLIIISVFYISATNNAHPYRLALLAGLATTTVYTSNSTNNFVYSSSPASAATSAGFILLSIINIVWIFYYGTTEEAPLHRLIDSYSIRPSQPPYDYYNPNNNYRSTLTRQQTNPFNTVNPALINSNGLNQNNNNNLYDMSAIGGGANVIPKSSYNNNRASTNMTPNSYAAHQQQQQHTFMAAPLGAFENSSDIRHKSFATSTQYRQSAASTADRTSAGEIIATPTEYPYRVQANYDYTAADPNELSFHRGEILEVSDVSGKWWQARRSNGEVGICPSNYVTLLDTNLAALNLSAAAATLTSGSAAGDTMTTTTTTTTTGYQNL